MAGFYIHIPFCKKLCSYCDFYFTISTSNKDQMLKSLLLEIEQRVSYLDNEPIETLYFGGGTPTIYSPEELKLIVNQVHKHYLCDIKEFTIEANPDDLSTTYLEKLKEIGVNRLSIGIQSFIDRDLKAMNRRHNAQVAIDIIPIAQSVGFNNISIDLMYGLPDQTEKDWIYNLDQALKMDIQHISSYHLSIEPKTILGNKMKRGLFKPIDDEHSELLYNRLESMLISNGFEHYEVSNFAKPGYQSLHNSSYWNYEKYIGVGPSAHSFNGKTRRWNIANNNRYIKLLSENNCYWEFENMSLAEQYNEFILTSLRTAKGLEKQKLLDTFGDKLTAYFFEESQAYLNNGKLVDDGCYIRIPSSHFLISDGIMADLFFVTK